jgi:hypothetical protein
MRTVSWQEVIDEDRLVSELQLLGITYLSNRATELPKQFRSPEQILADTIRQPSSRVRMAVIAVFLLHPKYAEALPKAFTLLDQEHLLTLKLLYMAAVYLQRQFQKELLPIVGSEWVWLPDQFGVDFGIAPHLSASEAIRQLGIKHQELTHSLTNWSGTYENVVLHLLRYKQRETQWNQSQHKS